MLTQAAADVGFTVNAAASAEEALGIIGTLEALHVMILDLNLPGMSGIDLFERVHAERPEVQAIILTGYGDLDAARRAIRLQVVDFLTKPCPLADLEHALNQAWDRYLAATGVTVTEARRIQDVEREMILKALDRHGNHRAAAARELGISLRTLYYRLSQYEAEDRMRGGH